MTILGAEVQKTIRRSAQGPSRRAIRVLIAGALAAGVFAVDTFSPLETAIAVFYVAVVLLAADTFRVKGIVVAAITCIGLTLLSYLIVHGFGELGSPFIRLVVSLSAIAVTTLLAVRSRAANLALHERSSLLEQTHDAIFVRDMADRITYWNRGSADLYGWARDEALGATPHQLLNTKFLVPLEDVKEHLLKHGGWEGQLLHTRRTGEVLIVASRWVLQRSENGQPSAILETNTDITDRARAQEQLQDAQIALEHAVRLSTLGELTASIAHEVNQPLAAIVANGEAGLRWLNRPKPGLDEARISIERVISDGRRASQVISNLRSLSRKAQHSRMPMSLNEVTEEVLLLLQQQLLSLTVTVDRDLAEALPEVTGDKVQLQQVILNLILNGAQAMSSVDERRRILAIRTVRGHDGHAVLEVSDNGIGLQPAVAEKLFMPFFTTKPEGMGMGLAICRSIIEAHDGRIWAESREAGGAIFRVSLPIHAELQAGLR